MQLIIVVLIVFDTFTGVLIIVEFVMFELNIQVSIIVLSLIEEFVTLLPISIDILITEMLLNEFFMYES